MKKAIVFSDAGIVKPEDLDLDDESVAEILPLAEAREVWQSQYINRALALNDGNRTKTARDLDVDPRTITRDRAMARQRPTGRSTHAAVVVALLMCVVIPSARANSAFAPSAVQSS